MAEEPQHLASIYSYIETGAVQFGDDRPGIFLRGEDALVLASELRPLLSEFSWDMIIINDLIELLESCRVEEGA